MGLAEEWRRLRERAAIGLMCWLDRQLGTDLVQVGNRLTIETMRAQQLRICFDGTEQVRRELGPNERLRVELPLFTGRIVRIDIDDKEGGL